MKNGKLLVGERQSVLGRQEVSVGFAVVLEVLGRCHRPKPLAQVALVETRSPGELGGRHRPGLRERGEDAEAVADVHQSPAHRGSDVEHDPLDKRFELLLVKLHLGSHLCLLRGCAF